MSLKFLDGELPTDKCQECGRDCRDFNIDKHGEVSCTGCGTVIGGIPGFPMESVLAGLVAAFAILAVHKRRHSSDKASSVRPPSGHAPHIADH